MFPFPAISLGDASGAPGTSLHGLRIYYFSLAHLRALAFPLFPPSCPLLGFQEHLLPFSVAINVTFIYETSPFYSIPELCQLNFHHILLSYFFFKPCIHFLNSVSRGHFYFISSISWGCVDPKLSSAS